MAALRDDDTSSLPTSVNSHRIDTQRLARLVLATFLFTFVVARILVIFIMDGKLPPQLFFHVQGTHVHHLNYGIFLLSITGAWLIFGRPTGKRLTICAMIYGVGLGLTFDEFGMWLHLGGPYWQRQLRRGNHNRIGACFDCVRISNPPLAAQALCHGHHARRVAGNIRRHAETIDEMGGSNHRPKTLPT